MSCCKNMKHRGTYAGYLGKVINFCKKCGRTGSAVTRKE